MPKLSDTQSMLLTAAAQRTDGNLLPLPSSLRGGAASKVVDALLARGFIEEAETDDRRPADPSPSTRWSDLDDGRGVVLRITRAGREALGIEPDSAAVAATEDEESVPASEDRTHAAGGSLAATSAHSGQTRTGTKQALLIGMLRRAAGATIDEIVAVTGWQAHYADVRIMPI